MYTTKIMSKTVKQRQLKKKYIYSGTFYLILWVRRVGAVGVRLLWYARK